MVSSTNLQEVLDNIQINNIKSIMIRTVGLIDVFGKMILDISYVDSKKESIELISPVPTDIIMNWLKNNDLLDKTTMYKF